ncbi:MAG: hypothetical protein Q9160_004467 [Pyrenula sp. 1 TL-2023]
MSSQGVHLAPYPDTPVFPVRLDIEDLKIRINTLLTVQIWRRRKYGNEDAEEWPISHTPQELRQQYHDQVERDRAILEADTPTEDQTPINEVTAKEKSSGSSTPQLTPSQASSSGAGKRVSVPNTPITPPLSSDEMPNQHCIFQLSPMLGSDGRIPVLSEPYEASVLEPIGLTASHQTEPILDADHHLGNGYTEAKSEPMSSKKRRFSEIGSGTEWINANNDLTRRSHSPRKRRRGSSEKMSKHSDIANAPDTQQPEYFEIFDHGEYTPHGEYTLHYSIPDSSSWWTGIYEINERKDHDGVLPTGTQIQA